MDLFALIFLCVQGVDFIVVYLHSWTSVDWATAAPLSKWRPLKWIFFLVKKYWRSLYVGIILKPKPNWMSLFTTFFLHWRLPIDEYYGWNEPVVISAIDVRVRRQPAMPFEPIIRALCCPLSLRKMNTAYHGDWHFFFLNTCTHQTPTHPYPPTITSIATVRHKHTLNPTYTPAGTDSIRQCSRNRISLQCAVCHLPWCAQCTTATPVHLQSMCHTAAQDAGGGKDTLLCSKMYVAAMEAVQENDCIVQDRMGMLRSARKVSLWEWWSTDGIAEGGKEQRNAHFENQCSVPSILICTYVVSQCSGKIAAVSVSTFFFLVDSKV